LHPCIISSGEDGAGRWKKGKITSGHGCIRKRLANDHGCLGCFIFSILGFLFNVFSNAAGAKTSVSDSYCMKKRRQACRFMFVIHHRTSGKGVW
jgi:hypothetical protein